MLAELRFGKPSRSVGGGSVADDLPGGSMTIAELPELVPARMLNEYAYCPRLFFLEWVDQLWAPSSDTAEGDRQHRRVDAGGGAAPLPSEAEVKAARPVDLSTQKLRIITQLA